MRFIEGLQKFLGNKCEIVVLDFRRGFVHSIVHFINGSVSGRSVGGSPRGGMISNCGKDIEPFKESRIYCYNGTDKSAGRIFKSCTTLIKDGDDKIIGSVCVNVDITDFIVAQNALQSFARYESSDISLMREEDFAFKNVDEVLRYYMDQCEQYVGKQMVLMNKEEKIQALEFLDSKGTFKITKASVLLCQAFQISKFTLYNYLEEARKRRGLQKKNED